MEIRPEMIWGEYEKGNNYLERQQLFENVKQNESMYEGDQWKGLPSDINMPKPIINVLGRSCKHLVAQLVSKEIAISMTPFSSNQDDIARMRVISQEIENTIETARIKEDSRLIFRNACVDGGCFAHQEFNPNIETGQPVKGTIENHIVDNTNVIFGNPYCDKVQKQPYIILVLRQDINQVKQEAKELGIRKEDIEQISTDNESKLANDDADNLVTVLIKYWKERKPYEVEKQTIDKNGNPVSVKVTEYKESVWFTKCTHSITLIEPRDLGYSRYPIAYFAWEKKKNSYVGVSPMTALRPNQIFINKTEALAHMFALQSGMPKIVYDKSKVDIEGFLNDTNPSAVAGTDIMGKFLDFIKIPDFSNQVLDLVERSIGWTKESIGTTDVTLGDVKPENTSAIVALQEASNMPQEIQKQYAFEFWEDLVRNLIDIMSVTYGVRQVITDQGLGFVDFDVLKNINYRLRVEIGAGAQYDEVAQINTLDKYLQAGLIHGTTHAKLIPSKYIIGKDQVIADMQAMEQQKMMAGINPVDDKGGSL